MPNSTPKKKFDGSAVSLTLTWDPLDLTWDPLDLTWQPLNPCFDMQPDTTPAPLSRDLRAAVNLVKQDLHARGILCDLEDARLYRLDLTRDADLRAHGLDLDPDTRQLRLYVETSTPNPTDR